MAVDLSMKHVSYIRVSTDRQGRSGLGLEAQREAVGAYLRSVGGGLVEEVVEVETGKGFQALDKRPELRRAMDLAKREKAVLVIAKLDRLARNVAFIAALMESGVEFVAADMPTANRLTLHIMAAFAEHEREAISRRTREALAAAKARGVKLGAYGAVLAQRNKEIALRNLAQTAPRIVQLKAEGLSLRRIASVMNGSGALSPCGGKWCATNVRRALGRLQPV
ncbi:MAG: recombinase family protein [Caulobacteraceae bacterium]|nr:recombinase family protein [Caulobacteraceae bacterium]